MLFVGVLCVVDDEIVSADAVGVVHVDVDVAVVVIIVVVLSLMCFVAFLLKQACYHKRIHRQNKAYNMSCCWDLLL